MSNGGFKLEDLENAEYVNFSIVIERNTLIYKLPFPCVVIDMKYYSMILFGKQNTIHSDWDYEIYDNKVMFSYNFIDMVDEGDLVLVSAIKKNSVVTNHEASTGCQHLRKYVNKAGFKNFWVCPDCKKDLGDYEGL